MAQHNCKNPTVRQLIESIVSECGDSARLLELYYWSIEPELLPIMRGLARLPSGTRTTLEAFIRETEPHAVGARVAGGEIRLFPLRPKRRVRRTVRKAA